jgi:hypothetical protein
VLEPIIARQQQSILNPGSRLVAPAQMHPQALSARERSNARLHDHQRKQQLVDINPILIGIKNTT